MPKQFFPDFFKIRPWDFSLGRNMFLYLKVDLNGKFEQKGEEKGNENISKT